MEILKQWVPSDMIWLISQKWEAKDYASFSMVSKSAYKLLMNFPLLQTSEIAAHQTVHRILYGKSHIFLTGAAGTGKSYTLNLLHKKAKKALISIGMTATTGMAATNIPNGRTLHSFAGISCHVPQKPNESIRYQNNGSRSLKGLKVLVIEEASMLSPSDLEILDMFLRRQNNPSLLMGGVKIVFCGDFFQLGPIKATPICLTDLWRKMNITTIEYTRPVRQMTDRRWFRDLNEIRVAKVSEALFTRLCDRYINVNEESLLRGEYGPLLLPTNSLCSEYNEKAFLLNSNPIHVIKIAIDEVSELRDGKLYQTNTMSIADAAYRAKNALQRTPEKVELKHDALYVLTKNLDVSLGHINGLVCRYNSQDGMMHPLSNIEESLEKYNEKDEKEKGDPLKYQSLLPIRPDYCEFTYQVTPKFFLDRLQIPFKLAHALTIHSSQGMTLQRAAINCGRSVFAAGQAYTALSRLKSSRGLVLLDLDPRAIKSDARIIKFYKSLEGSEHYIIK